VSPHVPSSAALHVPSFAPLPWTRVEGGGRPSRALVALLFLLPLGLFQGDGVAAQASSPPDPDRLLARAAERYEGVGGLCADFEQVRIVPLLDQRTTSRGRLCQRPPGYFLMDFREPEGDRVVADGTYLWTYFPSVDPGQVTRAELGGRGGSGRTFDFHDEFLRDPARRFEATYQGREKVDGRSTHVLALRPRRPSGYDRARVWLDVEEGLIRRVELVEENGSIRRITLSSIELGVELDPERFHFTPPEGVQVIPR